MKYLSLELCASLVMFEEKEGKKEVEQAATRYSRRRRKEKYFFFQVFHNDGVP